MVDRESADELGLVVLSGVVAREATEELGLVVAAEEFELVVPARTTALMSPP